MDLTIPVKSDSAFDVRVFRLVDNTHSTLTEFLGDLVVADGATDHAGPILARFRYLAGTTDLMNRQIFFVRAALSARVLVRREATSRLGTRIRSVILIPRWPSDP